MRNGVIAVLLGSSAPALADPVSRLEAAGFFGVDYYGDEIGLGGSNAPEQRPQTAPTFGARLTYVPLQIGSQVHLDLGIEGELSFTPSWTGYGFDGPRPSVFAPVFGFHGNLLVRLGGGWMEPHITVGGGGETVTSSSQFMRKETDPVFLWGVGASFPSDRWVLRLDARQGVMESMSGGTTQTYEAHVSIGARFGAARKPRELTPVLEVVEPVKPPDPVRDTDVDGIPDKLDGCPQQAELVNGVEDEDGCPEKDPDGDQLVATADKCPDQAEDVDKFEDEDGCPDDDNDQDGVADGRDACPNEPENVNGISDEDGCADVVPPAIVTALQSASGVKFERNRVRLSSRSKAALDKALVALLNNPRMKITLTVHTEKATDKDTELAKKRGDVVKWYLIEQGVASGNITTTVGPVPATKKAPLVVLSVTVPTAP